MARFIAVVGTAVALGLVAVAIRVASVELPPPAAIALIGSVSPPAEFDGVETVVPTVVDFSGDGAPVPGESTTPSAPITMIPRGDDGDADDDDDSPDDDDDDDADDSPDDDDDADDSPDDADDDADDSPDD
jgi:hypothetical protein